MSGELHDRVVEAQALEHLSVLCEAHGRTNEALQYARQALAARSTTGDSAGSRKMTEVIERLESRG